MSQTYAYACQRAELLGLPPPNEEEWIKSQEPPEVIDEATIENTIAEDLDQNDESLQHVGGGLDELNSILSVTQKKLNRFKNACGSIGNLLKVRVGSWTSTPDHAPLQPDSKSVQDAEKMLLTTDETITVECLGNSENGSQVAGSARKIDMNEKLGSHIDKLDLMISKAENAQYSMKHQTKQMRSFLK